MQQYIYGPPDCTAVPTYLHHRRVLLGVCAAASLDDAQQAPGVHSGSRHVFCATRRPETRVEGGQGGGLQRKQHDGQL